jgi:hypothetical protein
VFSQSLAIHATSRNQTDRQPNPVSSHHSSLAKDRSIPVDDMSSYTSFTELAESESVVNMMMSTH